MNNDLFVLILVASAAIITGVYAWRWRHIPGLQAFPLASLGILFWAVGQQLSSLGADPQMRLLWLRLSILGIDLLPIAWLAFVVLYTQGKQRLSWLQWAGLLALPALSQVTGTPRPSLNQTQPAILINGPTAGSILAIQHSVWGWAHLLAGLLILVGGGVMLVLHIARTPGIMRQSTRRIDVLAAAPMVVFLLETAGVRALAGLYFTPLAFLAGQFAFLWSLRRGSYFQVLPVARDLLIEKMDIGVLVVDTEGQLIDANPTAAALCGIPAQKLLGQSLAALLPQLASSLRQPPRRETIDVEITLPNGETQRWLDIRITPLFNPPLGLTGHMVEMQDVTRRRQAEEALRESEQRYRQVIDGMLEGVVVQDASGEIIACNPNAERFIGLSRDEILGRYSTSPEWRTVYEDGSPFPGEKHPAMLALLTGQRQSHVTMGLYKPDGSLRWLLINSEPLLKENEDRPYAVVSTFVDITEERQSQQTLRDSEKRFRGLLEFAPVAIIISDEAGSIQLINARAVQLFGYTHDELQGEPIEKLIPQRFRKEHVRQRDDFVLQSRSRPMGQGQELAARRKDGSEFLVDVGLNLIHTNQGPLVMSYLVDITERKQQEEALRQANEQLVQSLVELENHNRELVALTEMGEMLQICTSIPEAYTIVATFAQRLFPDSSGALYIADAERSFYDTAIAWGEQLPDDMPFPAEMCWALRRGRAHSAAVSSGTLDCQHVAHLHKSGYANYICVPMQAQGEVVGLFHLRWKTPSAQRAVDQLAATVAEQATLSLSNLMLRENLRRQSIRDPLTGVFNRRYMEEVFVHEIHRAVRRSQSIGVIMLDVDHFKQINDSYGHAYGDKLLKALANYLKNRLRGEDILCRYGGEEFTIILPDTKLENAILLAEKLRAEIQAIERELSAEPLEPIHISLGVSAFPEHGRNAEELLKSADWALYQAKQKGRDRVMVAQTMS